MTPVKEVLSISDAEAMERVLSAVVSGKRMSSEIQAAARTEYRQTDRVLQRLRKLGKIAYVKVKEGGKGWQEVKG